MHRARARLRASLPVVDLVQTCEHIGRIASVVGPVVRISGLQAALGDLVEIQPAQSSRRVRAEVSGFSEGDCLVVPYEPLDGVGLDAWVRNTGGPLELRAGAGLLGCVVDAFGQVLSGTPGTDLQPVWLRRPAPGPFDRLNITKPMSCGVRSLDALVPVGEGQRLGIFAPAGSGKTTLLGMLTRGCDADVVVIALIGERGREVREFIDHNLGSDGMRKAVIVTATSDRPALERIKCAFVATAIAEQFRDQNKKVLLLVDSLTRFARAQRELGLALGESPTRRGFPPSLFALLPQLVERAGRTHLGSITAMYTVLMEDEESADPVAEEVKSLLDGHIVLSPAITARGIYPSVDIAASLSRLQSVLQPAQALEVARRIRLLWSRYLETELLLQMGEYRSGRDAITDQAVSRYPAICEFLRQPEDAIIPAHQAEQEARQLVA